MLVNMVRQHTLVNMSRHRLLQETVNGEEVDVVVNKAMNSNRDIYGQEKTKLKTAETSRYFQCDNCGRKIAGGRFALHVNKCLERRRR